MKSNELVNQSTLDKCRELIENYQPSSEAVDKFQKMRMGIVVGVSGVGKDTIKNKILKEHSGTFSKITTSVTRKPRVNSGVSEVDGVDYHFLSLKQALKKLKSGQYIEAAIVHHEHVYGATIDEMMSIYSAGKIAIADVDFQGVDFYLNLSKNVRPVGLLPPSFEVWMERFRARYGSEGVDKELLKDRIKSAISELEWMLKNYQNLWFVINDDLEVATKEVYKMMSGESFSPAHEKNHQQKIELIQEILIKTKDFYDSL